MVNVEDLIELEVGMYVDYCRLAANKDEHEQEYRRLARILFYHIQEMRSTGKPSFKPSSLGNHRF